MRVVIASSFVPFIHGGGRFIVEWLQQKLVEHGHQVEKIYLPFNDHHSRLLDNLLSYRLMDMSASSDRLIAIRPPAHGIAHPNKVVWFIHHLRGYYDLAAGEYTSIPNSGRGRAIAEALRRYDRTALLEARKVFTNSRVVQQRLQNFNDIESEVLYPPLLQADQFHYDSMNDEIVSICRIERHKRQDLLVQAMEFVRTPVKLRLCGVSSNASYISAIRQIIKYKKLGDKVKLQDNWIDEVEKIKLMSGCLASVYAPVDEDSYGYPTLEAAAARKPTLTTQDAGGTLEFIRNGENGLITEASPRAIADGFDRLYGDRLKTERMGQAAFETIATMNITWDHAVARLLAA